MDGPDPCSTLIPNHTFKSGKTAMTTTRRSVQW